MEVYSKKNKRTIFSFFKSLSGLLKCKFETFFLKNTRLCRWGINTQDRELKIIVSLTSFPGRIGYVHKCVKTLLNQTLKPDHLFLVLAEEQFPKMEEGLPKELVRLKQYGLELVWTEDIKSYKKLVPIYKTWKDHIIVTADDDNYYGRNWLKKLYNGYLEYPDCIQCNVVTKFDFDKDDNLFWVPGGSAFHPYPSYKNKLVGCGGVLYPPRALYRDVCNDERFMSLAPTNDDLWFWFMAILSNTRVRVIKHFDAWNKEIKGTVQTGLTIINDNGEQLFLMQLKKLLFNYPEVIEKMRREGKDEF